MFPEPAYPTPVRACPALGHDRAELWLKNDGLSHPLYGGSKVRKAERLVSEARARGARRVLSFGAAGSHHLLTLTLFARAAGLESAAILVPQPHTPHAEDTLRAALGLGLQAHAAPHLACLAGLLARVRRRGDYVIPPGGSNLIGTHACADAVDELSLQISDGLLPMPDVIVLPLGSGGTCGGIAAGVVRRALPCRVLGVQVVPGLAPRWAARWLAGRVLSRLRADDSRPDLAQFPLPLEFDTQQVGPGYGAVTARGRHAAEVARELGLELDQTYTAKAFASVLELMKPNAAHLEHATQATRGPLKVLYWHTLSARPLSPLLDSSVGARALPNSLRKLFH